MRVKTLSSIKIWLLLASLAILAVSITKEQLGIHLSVKLANTRGAGNKPIDKFAWLGIADFDQNVMDKFNDRQLIALCAQAYDAMAADYANRDTAPWKTQVNAHKLHTMPSMMTCLAHEKTLYMASSVRGGGGPLAFMTNIGNEKVRQALIQCQEESPSGREHRTGAGCAEPMVMHIAFAAGVESVKGSKVCPYIPGSESSKESSYKVTSDCRIWGRPT